VENGSFSINSLFKDLRLLEHLWPNALSPSNKTKLI
jgi:hypothetical protein